MALLYCFPMSKNMKSQGVENPSLIYNSLSQNSSGKIGSTYEFNGNSSYCYFKNTLTTVTEMTVCCWVRLSSGYNSYSGFHIISFGDNYFRLGLAKDGNFLKLISNNNSSNVTVNSKTVTANRWYHICFVYKQGSYSFYVDGDLVLSGITLPSSYNFSSKQNIYIGNCSTSSEYGKGCCNDWRLYDEALSAKMVKMISNAMICHYPMNQVENNILYDTSGFINNGSISITSFSNNSVRYDNSMNFDGTSNYVSTGKILTQSNTTFAISCWLKPNKLTTYGVYVSRTSIGNGIGLFLLSNGSRLYPVLDDGNSKRSTFSNAVIPLNTWTHLCVTRTSTVKKVYINGVLIQTDTSNIGNLSGIGEIGVIGGSKNSDTSSVGNYFSGNMSDFRIYATALSDDDVSRLYRVSESITDEGEFFAYEYKEIDGIIFSNNGAVQCKELLNGTTNVKIDKNNQTIIAKNFIEA